MATGSGSRSARRTAGRPCFGGRRLTGTAAVVERAGHKRSVASRTFTRADGLPHATIQALVQAPDGRPWIGTNAGLAVYDGHEIHSASLPDSLQSGFVCTITAQAPDMVWVTLKGRGIVAPKNGRVA